MYKSNMIQTKHTKPPVALNPADSTDPYHTKNVRAMPRKKKDNEVE